MSKLPKPDELSNVDYSLPKTDWAETPTEIKKTMICYGAKESNLKAVDFPNARSWDPKVDDWKLPDNWKEIILEGISERLEKYRSFRLFMDICVRCGACADKCHFFIGTGDPKNMPVLRAELLRSVYKKEFTNAGKIFGSLVVQESLQLTY
jgi:ferredoxin